MFHTPGPSYSWHCRWVFLLLKTVMRSVGAQHTKKTDLRSDSFRPENSDAIHTVSFSLDSITECLKTLKLSNATTSAFTRPLIAWRLVILCYGRKDLEALGLAPRVGSKAVAPTKVVKDPQALKYGSSFTVKCSTQIAWALALRGQSEVNSNHVPAGIHISVPFHICEKI